MYNNVNIKKRVAGLKARLAVLDYICTGNLSRRYAVCGTKNCRCKARPPRRHGPYYYWSRLQDGKLVQRVLSREDAEIVKRGIKNHSAVKALLRRWEKETVRVLKRSRGRQG